MERSKIVKRHRIILLDGHKMNEIDETSYIYLGVFEINKTMEKEMKTQLVS